MSDAEFTPHPLVSDLVRALTELSKISPAELSEGDIGGVLSAIVSTQTVMYLELSTRGFLINVVPMKLGDDMPDADEMRAAFETFFAAPGE